VREPMSAARASMVVGFDQGARLAGDDPLDVRKGTDRRRPSRARGEFATGRDPRPMLPVGKQVIREPRGRVPRPEPAQPYPRL
jgi:hypothetical protein